VKKILLPLCLLIAFAAVAKPKPKAPREPAAPPARDTSLEDVEALDSVINSNTPPPPQKEELTRLAKLMLEKSPILHVALENLQIAQFNTKNTTAGLLPTFNISDTFGKKGLDPYNVLGPNNTFGNLTLTAKEVLYDNGIMLNTLDQNKKAQDRLRMEFEYTRDLQLLAVTQAYMDWSLAMQAQQLDEAKRKILGRQYAFLDSQFRQGYKTRRDVLRLESELRKVQLDTLSDESAIVVNRATLMDLLGARGDDLDKLAVHGEETGAVEDPGNGTDETLKLSEHRRLKILRSREQEADINIRLAQRDYWPQMRLQGDANYINDNYLQPNVSWGPNGYANWDALVIFSWTIWDWGIKKNTMEIARVNSGITADKNRQEELDLQVQLELLMRKLIEFKTSLNLSHELMTLERQNYTSLENDYRSGKAGYLDLITSINDYIDARTRFMSAYFNLRKQKLAYEFHKGDIFKNLLSE
jgi:outer membrane protein TolC